MHQSPIKNFVSFHRRVLKTNPPRVGRAQLYRLSLVDAHTVAQNQYTGNKFDNIHLFLSWHYAMRRSVNCHTMSWA